MCRVGSSVWVLASFVSQWLLAKKGKRSGREGILGEEIAMAKVGDNDHAADVARPDVAG